MLGKSRCIIKDAMYAITFETQFRESQAQPPAYRQVESAGQDALPDAIN